MWECVFLPTNPNVSRWLNTTKYAAEKKVVFDKDRSAVPVSKCAQAYQNW